MARKPGLARQPVAFHCGSGACAVTPALADDETWPERRCSDTGQHGGMLLSPGVERAALLWPFPSLQPPSSSILSQDLGLPVATC